MKHFKNIKIVKSKPLYKLIESFNEGNSFKIEVEYDYDKISTKFISKFSFKGKTFFEKLKDCYNILTDKPFELENNFKFKDGEHVVDVSDCLYLLSKEIKKNG